MTLRVVLYAEGPGETGGGLLPAPGKPLPDRLLGLAHVLVRRVIEAEREGVEVQFEAPLRTRRGRVAHGSDLLDRMRLRQLLTWIRPELRPDLAVVLADSDGDRRRRDRLARYVSDLDIPHVIGIATKEFEAWLIADLNAVGAVLGMNPPAAGSPERLAPAEAKRQLRTWIRAQLGAGEEKVARLRIASDADLEVVARRCRSFAAFRRALRAVVG